MFTSFSYSPVRGANKVIKESDRGRSETRRVSGGEKLDQSEKEMSLLKKKIRTLESQLKEKNGTLENGCNNDGNASGGNLQLPALEQAKSPEVESQYINWELMESKEKKIKTLKMQVLGDLLVIRVPYLNK